MSSSFINLLLFKPPPSRGYGIPSEVFHLQTSLGHHIAVTRIRRKGANVTLLYSHGNAEDLNSAYTWMKKLSKKLDVNVVGYDYTGYGMSTGSPSQRKCYADIETVYKYLLKENGLNPEQIVLYGRSLGSGPSCYLASKTSASGRPVAGLILHSPFTSVYRVVFDTGRTLLGDKFPNIDQLESVQCPVCIIHGQQDKIVPFEHGVALYHSLHSESQAEPFFVENMSHNYHSPRVESAMMKHLYQYLDFHILARQLWMRQPKKQRIERVIREHLDPITFSS